jgi:hypothetical protein
MSGPTLIAKIVPRASKSIMGKDKSKARLSMARLIDQWEDIIAPEDPLIVRPVRVGWKRIGPPEDKLSEGTLYIAAPSALAPKLTFQEAIIVGRVNRLFGLPSNGCIKRMALSHDKLSAPLKKNYRAKIPVSAATQARLDTVQDPVLKDRLSGLAAAMASESDK